MLIFSNESQAATSFSEAEAYLKDEITALKSKVSDARAALEAEKAALSAASAAASAAAAEATRRHEAQLEELAQSAAESLQQAQVAVLRRACL